MEAGGGARRERYGAFFFVVVLHWGLVSVLLLASRVQTRAFVTTDATATVELLARAVAQIPPAAESTSQSQLARVAPLPVTTPEPLSITYPAADVPDQVDWRSEGHKAAVAVAETLKVPTEIKDRRKTSSEPPGPHPWHPPSAHHAGEEYKTQDGGHVHWISDKCFVKSFQPVVPDLIPLHTLSKTECPRNSGEARGDLFEALPAYKKLHPEAAEK